MGRQVTSKRMRVYSLETNKLLHLAFARNYVNHLLPALRKKKMKIMIDVKASTSSSAASPPSDEDDNAHEFAKTVRFEVNMAMALSAKEFAWSRALEANLHREYNTLVTSTNGQTSSFILRMEPTAIFGEQRLGERLSSIPHNPSTCCDNVLDITMPLKASQNPRCDQKVIMKKLSSNTKSSTRRSRSRKGHGKKCEEENVKGKLAHLRTLLPGGNEMGDNEELLTEVASYLTCLKLQVQVLQCLVEGQ